MDFRLSDEQELLVDTARTLFTRECPPLVVRSSGSPDSNLAQKLFDQHLRDWVALAGGPLVDLALFLTEAGAAAAPGPYLATTAFFAPLLRAAGHPMADAAEDGEIVGTVVGSRYAGERRAIDVGLVSEVAFVLPGARPALAVVPVADLVVTPIEGFDLGRSIALVERPAGLTGASLAPGALSDAIERATVAVAAELVGVGRWLLDASVAYARERIQFGKPIGSFQAIQHKLVDVALAHQEAGAAVSYAAMCIDADDADRHRATHVAKAMAGLAARRAARDGLQVHGGVGFTWEHDLHLYLRRAWADDALCGTHEWHLDRLADLAFAPH